jgi:pSer/pThr/pTyr-binding forkhead associated (FHA) protein
MISEPEEDKKKELELIIQQSDGPQTSFFSVKQEGAKIGRHSSNQILILDESISRFHAEIKFEENTFLLRDTGSTTGTFIKIIGKVEITTVNLLLFRE